MTQKGEKFRAEVRNLLTSLPRARRLPDTLSDEAYFYGDRNFAHFHGHTHIDIRLSLEDQQQALATGKARPHLYAPQKGWVSCVLDSDEHVEDVKELVRKAYGYCEETG